MLRKFFYKYINSTNGVKQGLKDFSIKVELVWLFIGTFSLYFMDIDLANKLFGVFLLLLLLVVELINTALEMLCNKITTDYDGDIKNIKDILSASVFIVLMMHLLYIIYIIFLNN
jgi:diacylglycerol kinase (ATP)